MSKSNIYADDTSATIASNDIEKLVADAQEELLNISEWLRVIKLSPNLSKTEYLKASYADIVSGRRDNGAPINNTSILI